VKLERGWCYGCCPPYSKFGKAEGKVDLEGKWQFPGTVEIHSKYWPMSKNCNHPLNGKLVQLTFMAWRKDTGERLKDAFTQQ